MRKAVLSDILKGASYRNFGTDNMIWPLLLAWLAVAPEFHASLLDGRTVRGRVVELSAAGVVLETTGGREAVPAAELAGLELAMPVAHSFPEATVWVELVDGSRLAARSYTVERGQAAIVLVDGTDARVAVGRVASVRLAAQTAELAREWAEIAGGEHSGDVLVVRRRKTLDFLTGVIGDVDEATVTFRMEGEQLSVRRSRIEGLIYFRPPGDSLPDAFCRVAIVSGQHIQVQQVKLVGDGAAEALWQITSPAGLELRVPVAHVERVEFKVQYLSDQEPERSSWTDYFAAVAAVPVMAELYAPRRNRGFFSDQLKLEGRSFAKGLALRSRCEIDWRLPGTHRRLTAVAGIDDAVRPRGSVRLVVQGDARTLLEATVTGETPPLPIDLDITGVRRLRILVDFGDDLDISDYLNVCDARLID